MVKIFSVQFRPVWWRCFGQMIAVEIYIFKSLIVLNTPNQIFVTLTMWKKWLWSHDAYFSRLITILRLLSLCYYWMVGCGFPNGLCWENKKCSDCKRIHRWQGQRISASDITGRDAADAAHQLDTRISHPHFCVTTCCVYVIKMADWPPHPPFFFLKSR